MHLVEPSSLKCSEHTRSSDVSPVGTGISTTRLVLIDAPTPWPSEIADHELLKATQEVRNQSYFRRSRIFLSQPKGVAYRVQVFQRSGASATYAQHTFAGRVELAKVLTELPTAEAPTKIAKATMLMCTHGTRDTCCGEKGSALADEIEASGVTVERISHTAGHRYAPTMLSMPDGHNWAFVTSELVTSLLAGIVPLDNSQYRGWWGAKPGAQQQCVHFLAQMGISTADIESIESTPDTVTTITRGKTYRFSVTKSGIEKIIQCQVAEGGTIKKRQLYQIDEIS